MASKIAEGYIQLRVDQQTLANDLNRARGQVTGALGNLQQAMSSAGSTMAGTLGALLTNRAMFWLASQARELGSSLITANADLESFRISLDSLAGSSARGGQLLGDLKKMALTTPFELPDLLKGTQRMLAFGFSVEEVIPMLRNLGDVASAMPEGAGPGLNGIIVALGQMRGKNRVMAQEMNQLSERGVPAWEALAKRIGTDVPGAMARVTAGSVTARQGIAAILDLAQDPRFAGMMEKQSKSFTGVMSNLKDLMWQTSADIGEPIFVAFKDAVQGVVDFLQSDAGKALAGTFKGILGTIADAVRPIGPILLAAAPAVLALGAGLGTLAFLAPAIATAFSAISTAVEALFTPVGAVLALGAALGTALVSVQAFRDGFLGSWGLISSAGGELMAFLTVTWGEFFGAVHGFITSNGDTFQTWGALIAEIVAGTIRTATLILQTFVGWAKELWAEYGDTVAAVWYLFADAVSTVLEEISFIFNNFATFAELVWTQIALSGVEMADQISGAFWGMVSMANGVAASIQATFTTMWDNVKAAFSGAEMRSIGEAAAEAFSAGFDEIARSHWLGASELQDELRKERDALLAERDRAKGLAARDRRKRLAPGPAGKDETGVAPGAPGAPKTPPPPPEAAAVKFTFMGFSDMWKKVQETMTGGGMQDLARRTAAGAERTAKAAEETRDATREVRDGVKKLAPGLA